MTMHGPQNVKHFERKTRSNEKPQLTVGVPGSIIFKLGPYGACFEHCNNGGFYEWKESFETFPTH